LKLRRDATHDLGGLPELHSVDDLLHEHDGSSDSSDQSRQASPLDDGVGNRDGGDDLGVVDEVREGRSEEGGGEEMGREPEVGVPEGEEVEADEESLVAEAEDEEGGLEMERALVDCLSAKGKGRRKGRTRARTRKL